jgi:hypothetical protein
MSNFILIKKVVIKKMPIRAMTDIVEETRNAEEFLNIVERRDISAYLFQTWVKIPSKLTGYVHGAKGVLKPAVLGGWIHPAGALQLIDPPQPLQPGRINQVFFCSLIRKIR